MAAAKKKPVAALPPPPVVISPEEQRRQKIAAMQAAIKAAERMQAAMISRTSLKAFTTLTMPDPEDVDDVNKSLYASAWHHEAIDEVLEKVERGEILRAIIEMPPRHGKSEKASRRFPAWFLGRDPYHQVIFATYGADFAEDFGRKVREIMLTPTYRQVFPKVSLRQKSKAADRMETEAGGMAVFIGVGGPATGRGADLLLIDDPFKNREEAESATNRDKVWDWFTSTAYTRLMPGGRIVIILCMTGDTPVLLPDGTERRLDSLRVGDEVATYENGRLATSTVRNTRSNGRDSVFKITTSSGRIVRANGRHPFLTDNNGELEWVQTKNLTTAHKIFGVKANGESGKGRRAPLTDAKNPSSVAATACGITSRKNGPTDRVLHRATQSHDGSQRSSTATGSRLKNTLASLRARAANVLSAAQGKLRSIGRVTFASIIVTTPARFAGSSATSATLPLDSWEASALPSPSPSTSDFTPDRVVSVEPDGEEEVFDVQIDRTENFIANGLVSHNTRWHEDDIVGRIFNTDYVPKEEADKWFRLQLPAIIEEGTDKERALWPERYPLEVLKSTRAFIGERDWNALYQQRPTPPEGVFYKQSMIHTYDNAEYQKVLKNCRKYIAGDLALGETSKHDSSCVGVALVDEDDTIFISPDLYWDRKRADQSVEMILRMMKLHEPMSTWWEKGQIEKAVGPFLYKRMAEEKVYCHVEAMPVAGDKGTRSSAIRGRMSMAKVKFPKFAPWFPRAKEQMLKFTGSGDDAEDDFCDFIAIIGQGLSKSLKATSTATNVLKLPAIGTLGWIKHGERLRQREEKRLKARGGF